MNTNKKTLTGHDIIQFSRCIKEVGWLMEKQQCQHCHVDKRTKCMRIRSSIKRQRVV